MLLNRPNITINSKLLQTTILPLRGKNYKNILQNIFNEYGEGSKNCFGYNIRYVIVISNKFGCYLSVFFVTLPFAPQ